MARRPALEAALQEHLTADFSREAALQAFPKVGDLATAIALARAQGVSLQALGQKVVGPPMKDVTAALAELRPKVDAAASVRTARREGRSLLAPPKRPEAAPQ